MTEKGSDSQQPRTETSREDILELTGFPSGFGKNRYASNTILADRRSPSHTVFQIEDDTFTSSLPRPSHWSIAWSDLMMTMFVLFLSMFVYQMANQEFLDKKNPEIIGGDTTEALQSMDSGEASFPFAPIHPGLPLMTGGTVKKVEPVEIDSLDPESVYPGEEKQQSSEQQSENRQASASFDTSSAAPDTTAKTAEKDMDISLPVPLRVKPAPAVTVPPISPSAAEELQPAATDQFQEIYTLSRDALESNNLDKFAAIDIVPDKTMRIVLTGDLLFALGQSELSQQARSSLKKIVTVIQQTPYMINVVGHTDNLPMRSRRFKSNWELSVMRASSVAHFLIDEMGMNPNQFVVSGYSSYRPVLPNTTAENRSKNRRVEIIISKRLPNPLPATAQNLK